MFSFSLLVSAFVGTAVAFACFSAAAMLARRREYLYLGGLLSSGLSMLLWLHFASSIFGGSTAIFKFEVRLLLINPCFFPLPVIPIAVLLTFLLYMTAVVLRAFGICRLHGSGHSGNH